MAIYKENSLFINDIFFQKLNEKIIGLKTQQK